MLGVAAILSVVAAVAATHWYFALEGFGDEIGLLGSFKQSLPLLHRLVWLDGAIVAAICLVLIFRNRGRQPAAA